MRIDPRHVRLIGIHGPLNGGKDTAASFIQSLHPCIYKRYAFAKPIKDACKVLFGFSDRQLEDRALKEQVDPFWDFSPRRAMQLLGTEFGRDMLRKDVWIKRAEREHATNLEAGMGTIITDVRFENEAEWLRSTPGSLIINLTVPDLERDERYKHASEGGISFVPERDVKVINDKVAGLDAFHVKLRSLFC
jgi:hypothetical protein